ncbi:MAG: serine hydrolase [Clostridia bacterium]|nr:serine hydrolase [Clostridia bacterium]
MLTSFTPFTFETASPESVGISPESIAAFEERLRADKLGHQGYMLYRNGKLVAQSIASPYRMTDKRHVFSVSKTWTSTAIGLAVDEGLLSVEDSVISFFPELLPEVISDNLAAMKVRHLLSMNTGHRCDTTGSVATREPGWAKRFLALPVECAPGSKFVYNSTATYMLSAILTKITGVSLLDYIRPRLLNPLGIDDVYWMESPDGINVGGWGIHVSQEDMLKLGVLYLNRGVWNGRRILSEAWIDEATGVQSDNSTGGTIDWKVGYGYQIWRCQHNCFRADGSCGQYIVVSPEKNSVAVMISEDNRMQPLLDAYWDTIYASMSDSPLPPSAPCDTQAHPFCELPEGSCELPAPIEGKLPTNPFGLSSIAVRQGVNGLILTLRGENTAEVICGGGRWEYNHVSHCPITPGGFLGQLSIGKMARIAASYACADGHVKIALQFVSLPHGMILDLTPESLTVTRTIDRVSGNKTVLNFE